MSWSRLSDFTGWVKSTPVFGIKFNTGQTERNLKF